MSKIKVSEIFRALQGEGKYMGVPSVFVRTFGCNFRCRNFGRSGVDYLDDTVKRNPEVNNIIKNINIYKSYSDLPLVKSGCDSYPAVYPEFKNLSPSFTTTELSEKIVDILPNKQWKDEHLVITGGEPLLAGWQNSYIDLLEEKTMLSLKELTFETNGTQGLSTNLRDYLINWGRDNEYRGINAMTFSVSPKLSCSGESKIEAINPDIVCSYEEVGATYLKFVIATNLDAEEALEAVYMYRQAGFEGPVYFMAVGGVTDVYNLNNKNVAELALKLGIRYSSRIQVELFKNAWAT
jgi:organic radical activating enzyme